MENLSEHNDERQESSHPTARDPANNNDNDEHQDNLRPNTPDPIAAEDNSAINEHQENSRPNTPDPTATEDNNANDEHQENPRPTTPTPTASEARQPFYEAARKAFQGIRPGACSYVCDDELQHAHIPGRPVRANARQPNDPLLSTWIWHVTSDERNAIWAPRLRDAHLVLGRMTTTQQERAEAHPAPETAAPENPSDRQVQETAQRTPRPQGHPAQVSGQSDDQVAGQVGNHQQSPPARRPSRATGPSAPVQQQYVQNNQSVPYNATRGPYTPHRAPLPQSGLYTDSSQPVPYTPTRVPLSQSGPFTDFSQPFTPHGTYGSPVPSMQGYPPSGQFVTPGANDNRLYAWDVPGYHFNPEFYAIWNSSQNPQPYYQGQYQSPFQVQPGGHQGGYQRGAVQGGYASGFRGGFPGGFAGNHAGTQQGSQNGGYRGGYRGGFSVGHPGGHRRGRGRGG